jgi:adenosylcobinamide-phosphate synthase
MLQGEVVNTVVIVLALCLDQLLGEPRRYHPLVGFGFVAGKFEYFLNRGKHRFISGLLSVILLVGAAALCGLLIDSLLPKTRQSLLAGGFEVWLVILVHALVLYMCIGWRSLREHALAVILPLAAADLCKARAAVARIVSRDCSGLDETAIAAAASESVLENGSDALFAALFWYLLAGLPGVLAYRASNTLDALWGYRTERHQRFGCAAARLDDILNFIPARLTALSYALSGHLLTALQCWRRQAKLWGSPNAGPVMAAGAGSLRLQLGGDAVYHGKRETRPVLGLGNPPQAADIKRSINLLGRALLLWVLVIVLLEWSFTFVSN